MKLHMPSLCAKKYDTMFPTKLGRMCSICNTEVVDFTDWKTEDIISFIGQSNQKVCGKLKPLQIKGSKLSIWFKVASFISLFSLSKIIYAQTNAQKELIINGKVISDSGKIIKYGHITNNYNKDTILLDLNGSFQLKLKQPDKKTTLIIKVESLGYDTKIIKITKNNNPSIILQESWIGEVKIRIPLKNRIKKLFRIIYIQDDN